MSNNDRRWYRAWIPALVWLAIIALESSALGASERTARLLLPLLSLFFPRLTLAHFGLVHAALRKAGHFIGYAVLSLFMFRAWWATLSARRATAGRASWSDMLLDWSLRAAAVAWASTAAVAALDEWHQHFLPGRTASLHDVILDSAAGLFAQMLLIALSDGRRMRSKQLAISK